MSFILDALKKADHRRPDGDVPDLHADHFAARPTPVRRGRLFWLVSILIVLNLAALGGLYYYLLGAEDKLQVSGSAAGNSTVKINPESHSSEPARAPAANVLPAPLTPKPEIEPPPAEPIAAAPIAPQPQPDEIRKAQNDAPPAASPLDATSSPAPPGADSAPAGQPAPAPPEIMTLGELPSAVRAELPEFAFSMHFFTRDPAGRLVRVNDRILREGQTLRDGLVLREVTPQGAVFAYNGFLFEVESL